MSAVLGDPLTQLSFSVYENKGVFALLLGSGVSRAAQIPTGWEITLDLIRRLALAQQTESQSDWAAWYREFTGQEPDYSAILEELASSPEERRAILHSYIEPTDDDRREGRKLPTAAHRAIAALVQAGYIRVIVTTNFDRLMENALRERGIEPTVVASVDALVGAEPLTHSNCYIFKIHGDYKDARILNIETELGSYPAEYDSLLDRILDEHGLIICGWSGEWDHALRAAFFRSPNRRYSTFWAVRGTPGAGASELIAHRRARLVPIASADTFFISLQQRVETLQQSHRQNPLGIDLLVGSAKRFLAKHEYRIQLDELFADETEIVIRRSNADDFGPSAPWSENEFRSRVSRYESITEALASMTGVLGRWGDGSEFPLCIDLIRSLHLNGTKTDGGAVRYLELRSYPALLTLTAYGLGLVRSGRWNAFHDLFTSKIEYKHGELERIVDFLFIQTWSGGEKGAWNLLEGLDRRKTPLNDHLEQLLLDWGKHFIRPNSDFDLLFERFEILAALTYFEKYTKAELKESLVAGSFRYGVWLPVGRVGWDATNARKLVAELQEDGVRSSLLQAGFGVGDHEMIDLFLQNFQIAADRMRW